MTMTVDQTKHPKADQPKPTLRSCAVCGTKSVGWWCSTECYRADEGHEDERDDR